MHRSDDVARLIVNTGLLSDKIDLNACFGGTNMPEFALVYKIVMKSPKSMDVIRKVQKAFEQELVGQVDANESFIVFGREALVLDVDKAIEVRFVLTISLPSKLTIYVQFDVNRQPVFYDLV
jgi:hypothetical protein